MIIIVKETIKKLFQKKLAKGNKMKKQVEINYKYIEEKEEYNKIIIEVLTECFKEEELNDTPIYISITLTTLEEIKNINKEYRNIDKPTDVLSFPMFEKDELHELITKKKIFLPDVLGDIIICIQKVKEQSIEYEHSFERELAYMLVHGFYHLMGYDHITEEDKKEMRKKEEVILNKLKIQR